MDTIVASESGHPGAGIAVGRRLKALRNGAGTTLQHVARRSGLSRTYIRQIEAGTANPSVGTLKRITDALGLPIAALFEEVTDGNLAEADPTSAVRPSPATSGGSGERSPGGVEIVRHDRRKRLVWPDSHGQTFLLTPDLQRKLEVTMDEDQPGHEVGTERYAHPGEEFGIVLEGTYEVTVGEEAFVLEVGDSIYYQSPVPHTMRLIGDKPGRTIWVITPPSF